MATWPAALPSPMNAGYSINPGDMVTRSEFEAGCGRIRRKFTRVNSRVPVRWVFVESNLAIFDAWHKADIANGASWFTAAMMNGSGMQDVEARFVSTPQKKLIGPKLWEVSAEIEVANFPVLSQGEMQQRMVWVCNSYIGSPVNTAITIDSGSSYCSSGAITIDSGSVVINGTWRLK